MPDLADIVTHDPPAMPLIEDHRKVTAAQKREMATALFGRGCPTTAIKSKIKEEFGTSMSSADLTKLKRKLGMLTTTRSDKKKLAKFQRKPHPDTAKKLLLIRKMLIADATRQEIYKALKKKFGTAIDNNKYDRAKRDLMASGVLRPTKAGRTIARRLLKKDKRRKARKVVEKSLMVLPTPDTVSPTLLGLLGRVVQVMKVEGIEALQVENDGSIKATALREIALKV